MGHLKDMWCPVCKQETKFEQVDKDFLRFW